MKRTLLTYTLKVKLMQCIKHILKHNVLVIESNLKQDMKYTKT